MKKSFLKKVLALACTVACVSLSACQVTMHKDSSAQDGEMTVYMPDGAPALAMAKLMHEDTETDGVTYRVVPATSIASTVTYKEDEKNADFCVMPINAAAKLLKTGEKYVMLGAVTHGNLYIIAKDGAQYTTENISSLLGKKVGVLQINNVPGLTFKSVLNNNGVAWTELTNDGEVQADKVNLIAITDATAVGTLDADCFVIAEPAATAQAKKGYSIVGDLQVLYGGENGYPQAVLMAKRGIVESRGAWTADFVAKVSASAEWLTTATGEQIVSAVSAHLDETLGETSLKAPLLTAEVLSRCGVRYVAAKDCKTEAIAFVQNLKSTAPNSTEIPTDNFFWMDELK